MSEAMPSVDLEAVEGWDTNEQYVVVHVDAQPPWRVGELPHRLDARPSSRLRFTVVAEKKTRFQLGEKILGYVEMKLYEFVTSPGSTFDLIHHSNDKHPISALGIKINLNIPKPESTTGAQPSNETLASSSTKMDPPTSNDLLRDARKASADLLMVAKDKADLETQKICQSSDTLFEWAYKISQEGDCEDSSLRELSMRLNDTLGYARSLRKKPDAQDDIRTLALLAAEGAALIDEYFRPPFGLQTPRQDALVQSYSDKLHDFTNKRDSEILGAYNKKIRSITPIANLGQSPSSSTATRPNTGHAHFP